MGIPSLYGLGAVCAGLAFLFVSQVGGFVGQQRERKNERPIIGILSQEIGHKLNEVWPDRYDSYIAASYVKFVEAAGARVVPIWIGKDNEYYETILNKINGVLFPGGSTYFNQSDGYADAGDIIYRIATRMNQNGDYFPLWGTCLGFELLTYLAANRVEHRTQCSSHKQALPLQFKADFQQSRMYRDAPDDVINTLKNNDVTINFHGFCVTTEDLERVSLNEVFHVLSLNQDWNGLEFISSFEHFVHPFYGVQFHPEKVMYEWIMEKNIPHDYAAIVANRYFADFFVQEARMNDHHFPTMEDENEHLIYNYSPNYTALVGSAFEQCYLFKKEENAV